ncbi:phage head closure protein [Pseudoruegeria sp. HB172150]|uniref:phage head closure protein n=1 Tax=Pseudoruegeria sp. HB172150 TaxID=2721164 RepID=UPI001557E22E|nr:phage head closure protein [Pseudoruegeria sp. HB172150]
MTRPVLNRRLTLERPLRTRDEAGGYVTTWGVLGTLWASIRPGTGRDAESAGLTVSTVPYRITVRAAPVSSPQRPVPGQRLREGTRMFAVLAVTEADDDARYLTVFAREEEVAS